MTLSLYQHFIDFYEHFHANKAVDLLGEFFYWSSNKKKSLGNTCQVRGRYANLVVGGQRWWWCCCFGSVLTVEIIIAVKVLSTSFEALRTWQASYDK